jgi:hypothetical protein
MGWPKGKPRKEIKTTVSTASEALAPTVDTLDSTPSKKIIPSAASQAKDNPREAMFNELTERVDTQHDVESGIKSETPEEKVEEVVETEEETKEKEPEIPSETTESKEYVTVKIDGEESQVLKSDVEESGGIRAYQLEKAAAKRYQEAQDLLKDLKKAKDELLPSKDKPVEDAVKPLDPQELARIIQIGSPEEAAEAIRQLQSQTRVDPQHITRMVDSRIDFQTAVKEFQTEYQDIFSDPYLSSLATMMDNDALQKGDKRPYRERYKEIGTTLRKWKDGLTKPASLEEKKMKKATVTNLPSASARQAPPPEDKEETDQDYINHLRKVRGQTIP